LGGGHLDGFACFQGAGQAGLAAHVHAVFKDLCFSVGGARRKDVTTMSQN
jgi:hypothetical protein